jgi:hypothetical protein
MRKVAGYALTAKLLSLGAHQERFDIVKETVAAWLKAKGEVSKEDVSEAGVSSDLILADGRRATLNYSNSVSSIGSLWQVTLTEPGEA